MRSPVFWFKQFARSCEQCCIKKAA
jgi:hypothetical protein